jgi:hypothetical protein
LSGKNLSDGAISQPSGEVYTYMTGTHKTSGRGKGAKNKMKGKDHRKIEDELKTSKQPYRVKACGEYS